MSWKTKRAWKKVVRARKKSEFKKTEFQTMRSMMAKLQNEIDKEKAEESKQKAEERKSNHYKSKRIVDSDTSEEDVT